MKQDDNPAGIVSDIEWDISKKASGVYILRVEARAGSEVKSVTKKLAIIH
jgi:hypothetical protein